MTITFGNEQLTLLPDHALWWSRKSALILSDLHLGKGGHFRKEGIPVPHGHTSDDLKRLGNLILKHSPVSIYLIGDLFHSSFNREWELFQKWISTYQSVNFNIIRGNHDILPDYLFSEAGITIHTRLSILPFTFIHHPTVTTPDSPTISGHIHPAVTLYGKGRQSLRFPCFAVQPRRLILPSFGSFTGGTTITTTEYDRIFAIINRSEIFETS